MKNLFLALALAFLTFACDKAAKCENQGSNSVTQTEFGAPISVVDGKVRFYVDYDAPSSVREALGVPANDFTGYKLSVNGSEYVLQKDSGDNWYADIEAVPNDSYNAVLITRNSSKWFGSSAYKDLAVPFSQFWSYTKESFKDYPRFASYSKSNGNVLVFKDAVALLDLRIKGAGKISSVKVQSPAKEIIAGKAVYSPSKGSLQMTEGVDFAVVNCTENGNCVPLSPEGTGVAFVLAPASLKSGLEVTVCSSDHKMVRKIISPVQLSSGAVVSQTIDFTPDADLVWYEGFDNCVWGGNIMGGEKTMAYAPDGEKMGISGGAGRDGYSDAFASTAVNNPGTGFIQSNTWSEVSGKRVGSSHAMSDSYVVSRGFTDWRYLFRCQEYQGVMAVGSGDGNKARGIMQTPPITNVKALADISIEFKFCFQDGAGDNLLFQLVNAGHIQTMQVDGKDAGAAITYVGNASKVSVNKAKVSIPTSALETKTWHTVTVTATNATDGTFLYFAGEDPNVAAVHGFYLDDITVRLTADAVRKGNLRLLYWNIQNGMWSDQHNNYDNFVAFVKKYDPDICVWCEASSIYKDRTNSSQSTSLRYLPSGWSTLAARYGHSYSAIGGFRDNYPQVITSKYPINTLLKITNTATANNPVSHGAALHQVNVNGRVLHFVTCHMWPQAYGFGVVKDYRDASAEAHEGDYYRQFEMDYIISRTVNAAAYSGVSDWILLGDLNSRSRLDNWYLGYPADDTRFLTQDVVLNKTDLKDVIYEYYQPPTNYLSSTGGTARIDFVYASPDLMNLVVNALIVGDKWMDQTPNVYVPSFYDPSDHRPILIDFDLK